MTLLGQQPVEDAGREQPRIRRTLAEAIARRPVTDRPSAVRELVLVTVLWLAYSMGRFFAKNHLVAAFDNAHRVWEWERFLHLPNEASVQRVMFHLQALIPAANSYYAFAHFPAMIAFLVWLYVRRPAHYRRIRNILAILTASALVIHLLIPLAPPRMLTSTGMIDTATVYGPAVYGAPTTDSVTNQYAAMPSLHVGWALLIGIALVKLTGSAWRWLWLIHPALTLLVVVATANHYWLDGLVAGLMLVAIYQLQRRGILLRHGGGPRIGA